MPFYAITRVGVDLNNAQAFSTAIPAQFHLGDTTRGSDGSYWQYVCASSTVSAYSVVAVNTSGTMHMAVLGDFDGGAGNFLAVAQCNFAPNDYGWVAIHGGTGNQNQIKVKASGSTQPGVALYLATTSGNIATTAAASGTLRGIAVGTVSTTSTGVATPIPVILTWPNVNTLGA